MKKILAAVSVLVFLMSFVSCKKNSPASTVIPTNTATPVTAPVSIDDFEDGNTENALGGFWAYDDDRAFGGGNTGTAFTWSPNSAGGNGTAKFIGAVAADGHLRTFISSNEAGYYYGFVGVYTTFPTALNLSGTTGIKFYAVKGANPTNSSDIVNVWLCSKYESDNNINSHYMANVTMTAGTWQLIEIPWTAFTQGYVYSDAHYGSPAQSLNEVLTQVEKIGFDKEFVYNMTGISPYAATQYIDVDEITIY
jgi:hypothetical protein